MSLELRNYMKTAHPGTEISKPGYLKQRMKLNPLAFYELYRHHNRNFYSEPGFSTFHGYLVLAADGSGINIPTTKETLEEFGTSSRKGTKPQASIGLGCLYDVMNRMILESDCRKCKFDEMRLAEEQIGRVSETIGISQPFLVVMDRGYPSTAAFIRMMEKDILFLARLKSSDYKKEQAALSDADAWVDIQLDKSRIRHYKGTDIGRRMEELGHITLRMVKVSLPDGKKEVLITNLPTETFDCQQIGELYHMRWGIETAYETLKDRLQIENFTGTKPIIVLFLKLMTLPLNSNIMTKQKSGWFADMFLFLYNRAKKEKDGKANACKTSGHDPAAYENKCGTGRTPERKGPDDQ